MKIRSARGTDAEVIAKYNILLARESEHMELDPPTVKIGVERALADEAKARYLLAEIGGRVVGQLMLTHEWSDWRNGDIWWIQSVYVEAGSRGRGVFKALYRHVQQLARAEGAIGLRLYVEKQNEAAQQTYSRLGMSMTYYNVMEEML